MVEQQVEALRVEAPKASSPTIHIYAHVAELADAADLNTER